MRWFTAHIVMSVEFTAAKQDHFPAWENIVLIKAVSEAEAFHKAERIGHNEEGDDDGTFRWGKQPARWVFAGVRKLTECALFQDAPSSGDEMSYLELEFKTKSGLKRFVAGKPAIVKVEETFRPEAEAAKPRRKVTTAKRRRA